MAETSSDGTNGDRTGGDGADSGRTSSDERNSDRTSSSEPGTASSAAPATPSSSLRRSQWTPIAAGGGDDAAGSDRAASTARRPLTGRRPLLVLAAVVVLIAGAVFIAADSSASTGTGQGRPPTASSSTAVAHGSLVPLGLPVTPASRSAAAVPSSPRPSATSATSAYAGGGPALAAAPGYAPSTTVPIVRQAAAPPHAYAGGSTSAPAAPAPAAPAPRTFQLVGAQSNRCLDVPESSTSNGTQVEVWDCNGDPNQMWTLTASGQLTVYSGDVLKCLDAAFGGTTPGIYAIIWQCADTATQWTFNANGTVTNPRSGLCLDVTEGGTANGSPVELWTCHGGPNQVWHRD